MWLSHESCQRRVLYLHTTCVAGRKQPPIPPYSQIGLSSSGMYPLYVWSAKFANTEAKTDFQLHRHECTDVLRGAARGVPATAQAGADVPPNSRITGHLREDSHGVARGVGLAPPSTRQKAPEGSRVSIRYASVVLPSEIKSVGWLTSSSPARTPSQTRP